MKRQVEVRTRRWLLLIKFKKLSTFKILRYMSFLALVWTTLAVFTVGCLEYYYERG